MVNTFQKCMPPDFKFYLCKLNNKKEIQYGAMLIFVCFHGIKQNKKKSKENLKLHHMWKKFII